MCNEFYQHRHKERQFWPVPHCSLHVSPGEDNAPDRGTLLPCDLSEDRATIRLAGLAQGCIRTPGSPPGCGVGAGRDTSLRVVGGHHQPSRWESELQRPPGHSRVRLQCWALLHGHCFIHPLALWVLSSAIQNICFFSFPGAGKKHWKWEWSLT